MMDISLTSLFLLMFVGMGPLKGSLMFMDMTANVDVATRRKMAVAAVSTALGGALGLLLLGSLLQNLLHFSLGSLSVFGGIILLILSIKLVLGGDESAGGHEHKNLIDKAVSPLGTPLTLNPLGMVTLVTFSAETTSLTDFAMIIGVIVVMAFIDLMAFLFSGRLSHHISRAVITVSEKLFSILIGALAVQLILDGMAGLGLISAAAH
jgi:small neutral amino acid transporter SnatA (MarC family)